MPKSLKTIKTYNNRHSLSENKGVSTIEIIIVVAIITIALTSLLGVFSLSLNISTLIRDTNQAIFLAQEVMEAVRNFRDGTNWDTDGVGTLTPSTFYYPEKSGLPLRWTFPIPPDSPNGEEVIDKFTRQVVFERVSRNSSTYDIDDTYNPSDDDPDTIKVAVRVSWDFQGQTKNIELVTYLTNWK